MSGLERAIAAALARQRAALTAEFGWTQLELEVQLLPGLMRLRGCVALPRVRIAACQALAPLLPPGWQIDASAVQTRAAIGWRAPGPGVTRLWRTAALASAAGRGRGVAGDLSLGSTARGDLTADLSFGSSTHGDVSEDMSFNASAEGHVMGDMAQGTWPGSQAASGLATELLPGDGPVALLAELPGCALVRVSDGTVGWVGGRLGPAQPLRAGGAVRVSAEQALRRLGVRLRSYLGVRYGLGGATRGQIDCSGLVQRGVREALGLVLPRHSSDQLGLGAASVRALGEPGDLVFMGGCEGAAWHVGVVLRGPRPGSRTLLHASARRGVVVEEPLERGLRRAAGRVQHIELAQLLSGFGENL